MSTRSNPRIGQSASSLTSLGAVGGPRGTAAGALRVIVEFLTQYDPAAIKSLESDLEGLTQLEEQLGNKQISLADRIAKQRAKISQAEALQVAKFTDRQAKSALKQSQALRETGRPSDVRQAQQLLTFAIKRQGLSAQEEGIVRNLIGARTRLRNLEAQALKISQDRLAVDEQQGAVSGQLSQFQQLKAGLPGKLSGLAIGAVGGLVGGAIIGVGFQAAQAVLDAAAEGLKDLIDPARHARDAIHEVGDEINKLAEGKDLSREAAARQFLEALGITADENTVKILANAAAQDKLSGSLVTQNQVLEIKKHADATEADNIKQKANLLMEEDRLRGTVHEKTIVTAKGVYQVADAAYYEAEAVRLNNIELQNMDAASRQAAEAQAALQAQMEATAALASIAARALQEAIQAGSQSLIAPIDARIESLQTAGGESARTRAIQAKIEQLQNAPSGGRRNTELANIAEERSLILLRQRLRLLGTNIDLEKFEGKFLLEVINAKIKALQKQAAAEALVNRELDLQMRMSQQLKRQQGESVSDFLERRAKENRDQLTEQRSIDEDRAQAALQDLQERTQDEVALKELAERKKNAAVKSGSDNRIKNLQKELEASRKADAAALKAKIEALQKQKEALKKATDDAAYYSTETANEEIRQAIRAATNVEKIAKLSGAARGLYAAQSFLQALLTSGVLSPSEARHVQEALNRINATIGNLVSKQDALRESAARTGRGPRGFASGGYIPLNAGSTPFGRDARFGEHGTEAGMMVFSTQLMNKLRDSKSDGATFGDININRSDDPQRDYYRTEKAVEAAMRKNLS
jgi:hypothetical protein